jgi:hypothetical protein
MRHFLKRINHPCSRLLCVNILTFTYGDSAVIYSLKELAHFRSKLLVDFLHVQCTDLCLTGATCTTCTQGICVLCVKKIHE